MIQQSLFSNLAPLTIATLREVGELKKQRGMQLAADARAEAVAAGQVEFLRALITSDDGTATIDDATDDLTHRFANGGKWRGTVVSALARRRIIERIGDRKSDRPTRHRGYVSLWRLLDHDKAQHEIERLTAWLAVVEKQNPQSAATDAGNEINNPITQTDKESSNETN